MVDRLSYIEEALSEAIAAKLADKRAHPRDILVIARLPSRDLDALIELLCVFDSGALISILSALAVYGASILTPRYEQIARDLLLWTMSEVLLPRIKVGEGIGRAKPLAAYTHRKLMRNDIGFDEWTKIATALNTTLCNTRDATSRVIIESFRQIAAKQAARGNPVVCLPQVIQSIGYWIDRAAIARITQRLCELIKDAQ